MTRQGDTQSIVLTKDTSYHVSEKYTLTTRKMKYHFADESIAPTQVHVFVTS